MLIPKKMSPQHLRDFLGSISMDITLFCALWGWFMQIHLMDVSAFWVYLVGILKGLFSMGASLLVGLVIKGFYTKRLEPKLFKEKKNGKENTSKDSTEEERA